MLQVMDVIIGPTAKKYAIQRDDSRINQAEYVMKRPQKRDE